MTSTWTSRNAYSVNGLCGIYNDNPLSHDPLRVGLEHCPAGAACQYHHSEMRRALGRVASLLPRDCRPSPCGPEPPRELWFRQRAEVFSSVGLKSGVKKGDK